MPNNVPYAREVLNAFPTNPTPATDYLIRQADGRIEHYISDLAAPHTLRPVTHNPAAGGDGSTPPTSVVRSGDVSNFLLLTDRLSVRQWIRPSVPIPLTAVELTGVSGGGAMHITFQPVQNDYTTAMGEGVGGWFTDVGAGVNRAEFTTTLQPGQLYSMLLDHNGGNTLDVQLSTGHTWSGLTLLPRLVHAISGPVGGNNITTLDPTAAQLQLQFITGDMTGYDPSGIRIKGISPVTVDYAQREYTVSLGGESGAVAQFGWGAPTSETLGTASGSSQHVFSYTFDEPATLTKVELIGTSNGTDQVPVGTVLTLTTPDGTRTASVTAQVGVYDRVITLDPPLAMRDGTVSISVPTNAVLFSTAATPGTVSPDGGVTYTGAEANGLFCILHTGVLSGVPDNLFPITATEGLPEILADHTARITALEARVLLDAEAVQDIVGAMLPQGTYNDDGGTVSFTFAQARTDEEIQDIVAALIQAGANVTKTYDDAGNVLTISATGGGSGSGGPVYLSDQPAPRYGWDLTFNDYSSSPDQRQQFTALGSALTFDVVELPFTGMTSPPNGIGVTIYAADNTTVLATGTSVKLADSNKAALSAPVTIAPGASFWVKLAGFQPLKTAVGPGSVTADGRLRFEGGAFGSVFAAMFTQNVTAVKNVLGPLDPRDFPRSTVAAAPAVSGFLVVNDAAKTASLVWKFSDGSTKKVDLA